MGKQTENIGNELEEILGLEEKEETISEQDNNDESEKEVASKIETKENKTTNIIFTPEQLEANKEITKIDLEIEKLQTENTVDIKEFYGSLDTILTDEEQQLEFDDKPAYLELLSAKAQDYIKENSKDKEIEALTDKKAAIEKSNEIRSAITSVTAKHPNYNHEKIIDFYNLHLSENQRETLFADANGYEDLYEIAYREFIKANPENVANAPAPTIPNVNSSRKTNVPNGNLDDGMKTADEELRDALGL